MVGTRSIGDGRPRVGLALGGGAARGIAHVGAIRVLAEEGIRLGLIVGSSAGALAGACVAAGVSAERMEAWAGRLHWGRLVRPVVNRRGLTSNERLGDFLERVLPVRRFEELAIPFACMATDVETGDPVLLCEGDLISALRASCAVPGLVVPVEREGRLLVDGGVADNLPTAAVRELGADVVVAVDVNRSYQHPAPTLNMVSILLRSFFAVSRQAERPACDRADVLIAPDVGAIGVEELKRAGELVAAGAEAARAALPTLRLLLGGRRAPGSAAWTVPVVGESAA